jgi:predicted metal-binding membrane protein
VPPRPKPEPEPVAAGRAQGAGLATRIFSHDQLIVGGALAAAAGLAWWWLIRAGAAPMPEMGGAMAGMAADPAVWSVAYLLSAFTMWALMMVAMMLPSAAPMILLYARFAKGAGRGHADTAVFVLCYLAIWTGFSAAAALGQALLVATGLVSGMGLAIGPRAVAGALLTLAGLWQLSPLKDSCLETCRSPLSFMLRLWRPGPKGALRLGFAHGLYCLGCCWALMLLLFVGGVMNLVWIAGLAALVMAEKLAPVSLRQPLAALLILGGIVMVLSIWA